MCFLRLPVCADDIAPGLAVSHVSVPSRPGRVPDALALSFGYAVGGDSDDLRRGGRDVCCEEVLEIPEEKRSGLVCGTSAGCPDDWHLPQFQSGVVPVAECADGWHLPPRFGGMTVRNSSFFFSGMLLYRRSTLPGITATAFLKDACTFLIKNLFWVRSPA